MNLNKGEIFQFGDFVLIPGERLLMRDGEAIPLTPKAFDLLVALVRRSGHLVSKDELLQEIWPGRVVEEVNLSVNISAVRKALGRDPDGAELIRTVSKGGYRFVAPVVAGSSTGASLGPGVTRAVSANPDAYRAYLEGRYHWSQRSEVGLKKAIDDFQRAVAFDPRFAAAYSGMADSYAALGYLSFVSPADAFPLARRHALLALERDAALAEPHASLGYVKFYFDWDWPGAEAEFQQAIALDPAWAAAHKWYSISLLAAGRPIEALREIRLARERDPLSLVISTDLGFHYYYTRQYNEAIGQLKSVLAMKQDFAPAHLWLGRTYQQIGQFDDALGEFRQVEEISKSGRSPSPRAVLSRGPLAALARPNRCWRNCRNSPDTGLSPPMAWPWSMPASATATPLSPGSTRRSPNDHTGWCGCALIRALTVYAPIRASSNC